MNQKLGDKQLLIIATFSTFLLLFVNILRYKAPVAAIFGGSTFLHLSIIMSILNGNYPWQDPHYVGEFSYYPWLQHLIIALLQKVTGIPLGYIFNAWTIVQTLSLVVAYYFLGKTLKDEKLGVIMAVLILLARSTLRVELLPWPLYTSYILVPLFVMFIYKGFNEEKTKYLIYAGVVLGVSLLIHVFTFLMLLSFSLIYFLAVYFNKRKIPSKGYFTFFVTAFLLSSIFWAPLLIKYHGKTMNPVQEHKYKLSAFKSAYPFIKGENNPIMLVEDLILNRVVSKVEGGELIGDINNIILFAFAVSAVMFVKMERKIAVLIYSFLISSIIMRFHGYLPLPTEFQPIRFTDFFEHGLVMLASFAVYEIRSYKKILMGILIFSLSISAANFYINPNAKSAVNPDFGVIDKNYVLKSNDGKYAFITEVANVLKDSEESYGRGVVLANPITALYLAGLTGYKFVALPQGFSNVFVDVDERVKDAKDILQCRINYKKLFEYRVRYIVTDPLINSTCFDSNENFKLIYVIKNVTYPNPWKKAVGDVKIYVFNPKKYAVVEENGIPLTYYGEELGFRLAYHNVALKAREYFYQYLRTGDEYYKKKALFLTDFLISRAESIDGAFIWRNPFPWKQYELKENWSGSLMQAGILKTLLLAYKTTGNKTYLSYADKALRAFDIEVYRGGLKIYREGRVWYPEYAKEDPPYVLNGFITTLLWLKEYYLETNSTLAKKLYEEGLESLKYFLPKYDAEGWSYYDAVGNLANKKYHKLHVELMLMLYKETGDKLFLKYYERWRSSLHD